MHTKEVQIAPLHIQTIHIYTHDLLIKTQESHPANFHVSRHFRHFSIIVNNECCVP